MMSLLAVTVALALPTVPGLSPPTEFRPAISLEPTVVVPFQPIILKLAWENRSYADVEAWLLYGINQEELTVSVCPETGACLGIELDSRRGGAQVIVRPGERIEARYDLLEWFPLVDEGRYLVRVSLRAEGPKVLERLEDGEMVSVSGRTPEVAAQFTLVVESPRDTVDAKAVAFLREQRNGNVSLRRPADALRRYAVDIMNMDAPAFRQAARAKAVRNLLSGSDSVAGLQFARKVVSDLESSPWRVEAASALLMYYAFLGDQARIAEVSAAVRDARVHRPTDRLYWTTIRKLRSQTEASQRKDHAE